MTISIIQTGRLKMGKTYRVQGSAFKSSKNSGKKRKLRSFFDDDGGIDPLATNDRKDKEKQKREQRKARKEIYFDDD